MSLTMYLCIHSVFQTAPLVFLMLLAFRNKLRFSLGVSGLLAVCVCAFQIAATFYTFRPGYLAGGTRLFGSLLALLGVFAYHLATLTGTPYQILFTLLIIKSYHDCVTLFVELLLNLPHQDQLLFGVIATSAVLTVSLPFMYLFIRKCVTPITESDGKRPFWRYLWCIPACFYFIYRLAVFPGYLNGEALSEKNLFPLPYIWTAAVFLCYYVILRMLLETARNAQLEERLHISALQIAMQRELYDSMRSAIEETRILRHDIRHHLVALKGYTEKGDCASADRYLGNFLENFRAEPRLCENYAIDAVARHYVNLAQKMDVEIEASLDLPDSLAIPESDVCVVLGNLLENAVEACVRQTSGQRFIRVRAAIIGQNMVAISTRNSFTGEIRQFGEVFLSSKRPGEGIGIASVRSIAQRYRGTAKFEYRESVFIASVLLYP